MSGLLTGRSTAPSLPGGLSLAAVTRRLVRMPAWLCLLVGLGIARHLLIDIRVRAQVLLVWALVVVLLDLKLRVIGRLLRTYMLGKTIRSLVVSWNQLLMGMTLTHRGVGVARGVGRPNGCWGRLPLRLSQIRLYLCLCVGESSEGMVKLNNVALQVLGFVDDRHVLEIGKKPMSFTVSLIKILILHSEVL
jgi:hypothetical protein